MFVAGVGAGGTGVAAATKDTGAGADEVEAATAGAEGVTLEDAVYGCICSPGTPGGGMAEDWAEKSDPIIVVPI
jgi:hypothetical protein